ncbi:carbohydrate ABC transporter permease [Amycolatopsis vastitatis]|uniref:ABC transporter permease n=1 Tax=Amycolatopsis vastitatis TaxID=1905142 RepID=A0A229SMA0_9PSEU|nr:sugar ABC transporter permease [Amycolatopsis vastitatis]OXM59982.1 ABC transporter permease [Amycolatopsis vastitatis]
MAPSSPAEIAPAQGGDKRRNALGWSFAAPYTVLLALFGIVPTGYALYLAFTTSEAGFAGFGNFVTTFTDFRFAAAVGHIAIYLGFWLVSLTVLTVGLALVLFHLRSGRLSRFVRFLYYLPGALVGASSVLLWLFILDPAVSPVSWLLRTLGFDRFGEVIAVGHLPVLFTIIAFWTGAGGWIVVLYGALNNIPRDIIEAARIDGASAWQIARRIELPMLRKWVAYMVILAFAGGSQLFVEPQLLSQASLGVISNDYSLNQLSYTFAFQVGDLNGAAALSVELLVVSLAAAGIFVTWSGFFDAD